MTTQEENHPHGNEDHIKNDRQPGANNDNLAEKNNSGSDNDTVDHNTNNEHMQIDEEGNEVKPEDQA